MKKILALILTALLVLSLGAVAFAAESIPSEGGEKGTIDINKKYTIVTNTDELVPPEVLSFQTPVAATDNPDGGAANISLGTVQVTEDAADATYALEVTLPSYNIAGIYHYTIKEAAGSTQGVTEYDTTTEINISVLVEYEQVDGAYTTQLVADPEKIGITKDENGDKTNTLTNKYEMGDLAVTKEISGNLADPTVEFEMTVTFTAENPVLTPITVTGGILTADEEITIPESGTATYTFSLKGGDTIHFQNIPEGVTYTIVEDDKYKDEDGTLTTDEINDPELGYTVDGEVDEATEIVVEDETEVTITNTKESEIDTGITLDTLPYVLVLAVALAGVALMIARRRRSNED